MPSNHPQLDSSSSKLTASSHPCSGLLHDTLGKKQHDAINKQRDLAETLELWLLFARACLQEMERKHNIRCFSTSRLPIKKCPQELLLKIFRYYLGESSHQAIANLLLVCKHWYRLVMDSPEIWACVEVDFRIGDDEAHLNALCTYAVTCMRRSKGLLLDVIIRFETLEDAMSRIEWLAYTDAGFLEEQGLAVRDIVDYEKPENSLLDSNNIESNSRLLSEITGPQGLGLARWRSFTVVMPDYSLNDSIHDLFRYPAPNITHMSIRNRFGNTDFGLSLPAVTLLVATDCKTCLANRSNWN